MINQFTIRPSTISPITKAAWYRARLPQVRQYEVLWVSTGKYQYVVYFMDGKQAIGMTEPMSSAWTNLTLYLRHLVESGERT